MKISNIIDELNVISDKLKGLADTLSMVSECRESVIMTPEQMVFFELSIREIEDQVTKVCDRLNKENHVQRQQKLEQINKTNE